MMIKHRQLSQIEIYLYNIIIITSWLRKANENLEGIQDTIELYRRIDKLADRLDKVMLKLE